MTSALEKLEKILQLEQEQGFRDKAVIGGLARFADAWQKQAQHETEDEAWVVQVAEQMQTYSRLTTRQERQSSLEALRAILQSAQVIDGPPSSDARSQPTVELASSAPPPRSERPARRAPEERKGRSETPQIKPEDIGLDSPVTVLSGIGPTQSKRLARLGLHTIREMLYFFPRRYDDFSTLKTINQLEYGEEVTIMGRIWDVNTRKTRSGKVITTAIIEDGSGTIEVTWFNQPHLAKALKPARQIVLSGQVDEYLGRLTFQAPQWEPLDRQLLHTARLVPIYPLTQGISARWLRKLMKRTVDYWSHRVPDHLPEVELQRLRGGL
jgi:ATP-dependent DNA helicase RecG